MLAAFFIRNKMKRSTYIFIIGICTCLCLPVGIVQLFYYLAFKKSNTEVQRLKLENSLKNGLVVILLEITIIGFLFYQFGRHFIHVIGTFY
jgi:hypothetical protein